MCGRLVARRSGVGFTVVILATIHTMPAAQPAIHSFLEMNQPPLALALSNFCFFPPSALSSSYPGLLPETTRTEDKLWSALNIHKMNSIVLVHLIQKHFLV